MTRPNRSPRKVPVSGVARRKHLERGRAACARRAWDDAYASFALADRTTPLVVADLEQLALCAGLTGRVEQFLGAFERLYNAHLDAGEELAAARAAFWIGFRLYGLREPGRASGWIARSQRLVEKAGKDCVERGYLCLPAAQRHLGSGECEAACEAAATAAEIGDRFRDRDLSAFARNLHGRALLRLGRIKDGLALIDEAMVAVAGRELTPVITGLIYCIAIAGCQQVYALGRAREWTSALTGWCEAQPQLVTFTSACHVHRAEIQQLSGAWPEAIEEARRVSARSPRADDPGAGGDAFYQEAEIHRLRGEGAAAEAAYRKASQAGREPQPGLALLRLAQGDRDAAASGIRRALGGTSDPLQRARLLPAGVEILLDAGDVEAARAACEEIESIAARFETEALAAIAAQARGTLLLAESEGAEALGPLRRAFTGWQEAGAPYLAARVRVLLALACRGLGDRDGAALELEAARATFERLGAKPDLDRLDTLREEGVARPHGLTARELEVLRLVATGKTNKAIAKQLFLSGKTVDRHVSNIFTKVHVRSRAAATAFAYKNKLV